MYVNNTYIFGGELFYLLQLIVHIYVLSHFCIAVYCYTLHIPLYTPYQLLLSEWYFCMYLT